MLVLTRKSQEAVVIRGSAGFERLFKVIVLEVERGNVKLGFPVHRLEVWERIRANGRSNRSAGGSAAPASG